MSEQRTASEIITDEVTSWPGVEAGYGKRGEWGFRVNGHEVGHLHGALQLRQGGRGGASGAGPGCRPSRLPRQERDGGPPDRLR